MGAGVYFTVFAEQSKGAAGPVSPEGNLHDPYSFESIASAYSWEGARAGDLSFSISTKQKSSGKSSLEIRCKRDEGADAFYSSTLPAENVRYRLKGKAWTSGRGRTKRAADGLAEPANGSRRSPAAGTANGFG